MAAAVAGLLLTVTHLDMADLRAGAMDTCDDLTVDDESATDTGAEGHHHEIIVALTATLPHLAEGGNIGIVSDGTADLSAHELLHLLRRPVIMPAEVDTDVHITVRLDRTRHTDADALDVRALDVLLLEALLQRIRDIRKDILSVLFLTGRHLPLIHQNTGECEDTALHRRSAYIYTYTILIHMSPLLLLQLYRFHRTRTSDEQIEAQRILHSTRHTRSGDRSIDVAAVLQCAAHVVKLERGIIINQDPVLIDIKVRIVQLERRREHRLAVQPVYGQRVRIRGGLRIAVIRDDANVVVRIGNRLDRLLDLDLLAELRTRQHLRTEERDAAIIEGLRMRIV